MVPDLKDASSDGGKGLIMMRMKLLGWIPLCSLALLLLPPQALCADQHSVESIVAALKSPISPEAVAQARDGDDKLISGGAVEGVHVYLVTDERSTRVNSLAAGLLRAAGQNPSEWVVRVLDTDPKLINAFVMGGKYVYVYTGLLAQNPSDDELAFILSHELGHSMLKHKDRQANDQSTTWAGVAGLAALFSSGKNRDVLNGVATAITNSYSRGDEEEADAIGCCLAHRAGFDALRGADFFTRSKREADAVRDQRNAELVESKSAYEEAVATCLENKKLFESSLDYQTQGNAKKVNAMCADAEQKRLAYNQVVDAYNAAATDERRNVLLGTHPQDQSRVAAITATTDFLAGRRDLSTLSKFEQTSRVIVALQQTDSELLKPPLVVPAVAVARDTAEAAPHLSLDEQLRQLKRARDQGLITEAEYQRKRAEILARY
jgi:Zn-dependent protease with chaperone function